MVADDAAARWERRWQERRRMWRAQELDELRASLPAAARELLDEASRIADSDDLAVHAAADVDALVDRMNLLEGDAPILLHRPISNHLTALRNDAQELLAARDGAAHLPALNPARPPRPPESGLRWSLVVGEDNEVRELVAESEVALRECPLQSADSLESALAILRASHDGSGLVVVNLTLRSAVGIGPHGLEVAQEARRRRHAVLLVTAAGNYFHYWPRLEEVGLTGHDVIIKTRRDFGGRLRSRIAELAQPGPVLISYSDDTGHVVRIGDVEVSDLEAQEALVVRALDGIWRSPSGIAEACWHTDLAPPPGSVPSLISTIRRKLRKTLTGAESEIAQCELIESQSRDHLPTRYRLAPWLRWVEPPDPVGAPRVLPPVLVIEDEPDWAEWVTACLDELDWPARLAATAEEARTVGGRQTPIVIADLGLPDPVSGLPNHQVGLALVRELCERQPDVRVIVLSVYGGQDGLRSRLFEAGVRTVDVIDKAADRDERRAVLRASLQRAADELWRHVRRVRESLPTHRLVRRERTRIEVDGHTIDRLTSREAAVLDLLIQRPNEPVTAEMLEDRSYPAVRRARAPAGNPLNKVHQTFKRLRQKIDSGVGHAGTGASVLRTPHRGAITTYELHALVTDLTEPATERPDSGPTQ